MKRLCVTSCLLLISMLIVYPVFASDTLSIDSRLLSIFYALWKDSGFGNDPNRTERAAWILRESSFEYTCLRWPTSGERNKEFWQGPLPPNTVAQAHTHTVVADPKPSSKDIHLCMSLGIPVYVISAGGIWVVTPDGEASRVQDSTWYKSVGK